MKPVIAVVGPTASGKTRRAVELARALGTEIISADSRQVYRGMTLGTGKDLDEYGDVPYHLIDIADAGGKYNLHRFVRDYEAAERDMRGRGLQPLLCGGSGMYVETVLAGIRLPEVPENKELRESLSGKTLAELTDILASMKRLHNTTDVDTCARAIRAIEIETYYADNPEAARNSRRETATPRPSVIIGIDIDRDSRRQRVSSRLDQRLRNGMVEEVRRLLDSGIPAEDLIYYGLEYKFVTEYLIGRRTYQDMRDGLEIAIHQFAKRQMTWFRGMERRGFKINWLAYDLPAEAFLAQALSLIRNS